MSSAGKKGEVILNNIPYYKIIEKIEGLEFETIESATKGGEQFIAYKLIH